uniref:Transmembrane protein n=1 Tax=Pithovirus LCPAC102 TaxID=2506587 RepID=A0A481Z3S5_9VIRU|nr:MAG: hypothetical protein LCPAC102_00980 [Pithovirus LCPAC102]
MESFRGTPLCRYGYGSVLFYIVFTFVLGFIFAPFSHGFLYFSFFWVIWFIGYSFLVHWKYPNWRLLTLAGVFSAGLTGFILGRFIIGDPNPFRITHDD